MDNGLVFGDAFSEKSAPIKFWQEKFQLQLPALARIATGYETLTYRKKRSHLGWREFHVILGGDTRVEHGVEIGLPGMIQPDSLLVTKGVLGELRGDRL